MFCAADSYFLHVPYFTKQFTTCDIVLFYIGGVVWRVKCSDRKLVCAVGSRNGIEDTKLLVLDFDIYP